MGYRIDCEVEILVPVVNYEWESSSTDHSLTDSISIYMPCAKLISALSLKPSLESPGYWKGPDQQTVFHDPSVSDTGPSTALCHQDKLFEWLEENDLQLVWFVGGEKQLLTRWADDFFGRLAYSGVFTPSRVVVKGEMWFEQQK